MQGGLFQLAHRMIGTLLCFRVGEWPNDQLGHMLREVIFCVGSEVQISASRDGIRFAARRSRFLARKAVQAD